MSTPEPRPDGIVPPHIRERLPKPKPRLDAAGLAVVIIAAVVALGWAVAFVISALPVGDGLDDDLLNGIGLLIVEAVVIFVSYRVGRTQAGRGGRG